MRFQVVIQRFSISFFTLLILFILGELGMRAFGVVTNTDFRIYLKELNNSDRHPKEIFINDMLLGYRLRPSTQVMAVTSDFQIKYAINSKGLRDKEYSYDKPQGKVRVLALGDSYTFGEGVNYGERFTDIPEIKLQNVDVINSGVPGWGIDKELLFLASEGIKYNPDYVFLFLNCEDTRRDWIEVRNNQVIMNSTLTSTTTSISIPIKPIFDNSYLLSFIKYQYTILKLKGTFKRYDKGYWKRGRKMFKPGEYLDSEPALQNRTRAVIQKMADIAIKNGAEFYIVKIDEYSNLSYVKETNGISGFFDLTNGLKFESKMHPLAFKYDPHYNSQTHHWIGEQVTEILGNLIRME